MNSTSLKIKSLSNRKDFFIRIENIRKHVTANNNFHIIEISVVSLHIYIDRNRREDYSIYCAACDFACFTSSLKWDSDLTWPPLTFL